MCTNKTNTRFLLCNKRLQRVSRSHCRLTEKNIDSNNTRPTCSNYYVTDAGCYVAGAKNEIYDGR